MTEDEYEFEYNVLWDEFHMYLIERDTMGMKHRRLVATGDKAKEMKEMMRK